MAILNCYVSSPEGTSIVDAEICSFHAEIFMLHAGNPALNHVFFHPTKSQSVHPSITSIPMLHSSTRPGFYIQKTMENLDHRNSGFTELKITVDLSIVFWYVYQRVIHKI